MNVVCISGRLVESPKIFKAALGTIASLSIAVYMGKDGKGVKRTSFFRCVTFDVNAIAACAKCQKGMCVQIVGELYQDKYFTKDGEKRADVQIRIKSIMPFQPFYPPTSDYDKNNPMENPTYENWDPEVSEIPGDGDGNMY